MSEKIVLLYDTKLNRPGCVILQAMAGCARNNEFLQLYFDDWLTSPTPDMKLMRGTREQWIALATRSRSSRSRAAVPAAPSSTSGRKS